MLLEGRNVLVEAEQSSYKHLHLSTTENMQKLTLDEEQSGRWAVLARGLTPAGEGRPS